MGRKVEVGEISYPIPSDPSDSGTMDIKICDWNLDRTIKVEVMLEVPVRELDKVTDALSAVDAAVEAFEEERRKTQSHLSSSYS